jgi:hypothetical protein
MNKLVIPSCRYSKLSKVTPALVATYCARYDFNEKDEFECGYCANNDLWTIPEMLWSEEDEFLVTPCCHTEAITALRPDNPRNEYDLDQAREDYETYVWTITGR